MTLHRKKRIWTFFQPVLCSGGPPKKSKFPKKKKKRMSGKKFLTKEVFLKILSKL
jgi:hypothetical protein